MYSNNKLSKAVRLAIAFGAASAFAGSAIAQQAQDDEASAKVERIEVTGSRIKRSDMETASPVSVIGRDQIDSSGFQNIGDLLRNINQADVGGLTQLTNNTNANDGSQTLSLRNLGAQRSLVLVDGRRWLALGGGQVDISQIPLAAVERIEVLADGASAVYGSDAIAGVVNIITKKGFEGLELDLGTGANFEGDGENYNAGLTIGAANSKTSILFNINKIEQKEIMAGDREISKYPIAGVPTAWNSSYGEFGFFVGAGVGSLALDPSKEGAGARVPGDFIPYNGDIHSYNYAPANYLFTPSSRLSTFIKLDHEFTDNIRGFGQFTYNQRKSVTQIAPVPMGLGVSAFGPQWNIPVSANNVYNPFGVDLTQARFRASPIGPRTSSQDYDTYFATLGLEGAFELASKGFDWDISYSRGESTRGVTGTNYINLDRLRKAVGPSFIAADGKAYCGTQSAIVAGCVPLNLFNGVTGFTKEMSDYLSYTLVEQVKTSNTDLSLNLSGELFELPAGAVGVAVGAQFRTNTFMDQPDSIIEAGLSSTNFRMPTNGTQKAKESYFEFSVPLLRDLPAVQALELSLAGRFSDFDNAGLTSNGITEASFDNESFKIGFTWRVFEDLMLRGNYSDTFRAPSVNNLYGGLDEGFPSASDPCARAIGTNALPTGYASLTPEQVARCTLQGVPSGGVVQPTSQLRALTGGNPELIPESGNTTTFGVVYNPSWLDGFDMTVDYWKIELEDALALRGAASVLNRCIRQGLSADCGLITRDVNGNISAVEQRNFNLLTLEVAGVDASFNYNFNTDFGRFRIALNTTWTDKYVENNGINEVGSVDSDVYRWRSNLNTTWAQGDWSVTWAMRHTSALVESCWIPQSWGTIFDPCNKREEGLNRIGSTIYHDVSASYQTSWNATVRVGTRNLFRKDPPVSVNSFANSFLQTYDIPGGTWFVQYRQQF